MKLLDDCAHCQGEGTILVSPRPGDFLNPASLSEWTENKCKICIQGKVLTPEGYELFSFLKFIKGWY